MQSEDGKYFQKQASPPFEQHHRHWKKLNSQITKQLHLK